MDRFPTFEELQAIASSLHDLGQAFERDGSIDTAIVSRIDIALKSCWVDVGGGMMQVRIGGWPGPDAPKLARAVAKVAALTGLLRGEMILPQQVLYTAFAALPDIEKFAHPALTSIVASSTQLIGHVPARPARNVPKVFISYSWESEDHKRWVRELAARLRTDGVDVMLDKWEVVPGDQLPRFMERAIRENDFVLIVCTPEYKRKVDAREGAAGYEGDIMAAEVLTKGNHRKFIPVLRIGTLEMSMPSALLGKYAIDLSGAPFSEEYYHDLLTTLHDQREKAPPVGKPPPTPRTLPKKSSESTPKNENAETDFQPIKILGVLASEAGRPKNDGTSGSALYAIPFKLNRVPTQAWADLFISVWNNPSQFTTRHRPGIAQVEGDRIILTRTTIDEVRDVHRATLKLAIDTANSAFAERLRQKRIADEAKVEEERKHREHLRKIADDLRFE